MYIKTTKAQLCFILCLLLSTCTWAQDLVAYHVVGKVNIIVNGKASPLVMKAHVKPTTTVEIPYGGKLELLDEAGSKRIILKTPGRATVNALMASSDNSVSKLSSSYVAYVKKQMGNSGLVSQQRYTDFATVTRQIDSVAQDRPMPSTTAGKTLSFQDRFNQFAGQAHTRYDNFRAECNRKYIEFVRKAWEEFDQLPAVEKPEDQRIKPVVVPDTASTDRFLFFKRKKRQVKKEMKADQLVNSSKPQPQPVAPIQEIPIPEEELVFADMPFTFYGTEMHVRLDETKRINLGEVTPDRVADALQYFSTKTFDNLLYDCLKIRKEKNLCDWAYLLMLKELTDQFCGAGTNEASLMLGYLYCQSGYKIRFASCGKKLHLLIASPHIIYGRVSYRIDGELYYPLEDPEGPTYICKASFPKEQTLSLLINSQPVLDENNTEIRVVQSERYPEMKFEVKTNSNLMHFYDTYPTSFINGDITTRWVMYANTPMAEAVKQQIYPTLREKLKGMSQLDAVNRLLNLVQTGFTYEYDDVVWGGDRAFFAEETLHYPFCDCEDRAILFTRLVRDLLGMECALVYYPGHLAAAVHFDELPGGVYYSSREGKDFTLCDPTYIRAYVGEEMKDFQNATVNLIVLK